MLLVLGLDSEDLESIGGAATLSMDTSTHATAIIQSPSRG